MTNVQIYGMGLETCSILTRAYATLSLEHNIAVFSRMRGNRILERLTVQDCNTPHSCDYRYKLMEIQRNDEENFQIPIDQTINYKNAFALLILNASIIEGGLRTILSEQIHSEREQETQYRVDRGLKDQSKTELFFLKFLYDVETQGGWEKLQEQYLFFNNISLNSLMKQKDPDLREAINTLFILRNILSHGTAIVQPNQPMDESMQNLYPYKWQCKLQQGSVYLKKIFGKDNIFENLAEYSMPEHFWHRTQELFNLIESKFIPLPSRSTRIVEIIKQYRFGYNLPSSY